MNSLLWCCKTDYVYSLTEAETLGCEWLVWDMARSMNPLKSGAVREIGHNTEVRTTQQHLENTWEHLISFRTSTWRPWSPLPCLLPLSAFSLRLYKSRQVLTFSFLIFIDLLSLFQNRLAIGICFCVSVQWILSRLEQLTVILLSSNGYISNWADLPSAALFIDGKLSCVSPLRRGFNILTIFYLIRDQVLS